MGAMKHAYFITATGTDLGKTWVTAGVAQACRVRGRAVRAVKPVMSGYDESNPVACDAGVLLQKLGGSGTEMAVAEVSPWRFAAPLSPDRAAALEGRSIDFDELVGWCRAQIERNPGLLLIEGVGGVMVPLDARHTVRDWIAALAVPTVLVVGTHLGSLSHALTALAALRESGGVPVVIVVNESAGSTVGVEDTVASLAPHVGAIPLIILRRDDAAGLARLADFLTEDLQ
jgi:dethiobiotin synthetase